MKPGESVLRFRAYRRLRCRECKGEIPEGSTFLMDIIPEPWGRYKHIIHERHWRGPTEAIVDRTRYCSPGRTRYINRKRA